MDSPESEFFPGAFLLAAGNLARQVLEQVVFILAFYGDLPRQSYLRPNGQPRTLDAILRALAQRDSSTGKTYLALARLKGPRIRSSRAAHGPCIDGGACSMSHLILPIRPLVGSLWNVTSGRSSNTL